MKILFLLKEFNNYGGEKGSSRSGLLNSAKFVANALQHFLHIESVIEIVVDANSIDKCIYDHQPDMIILEALWVTPAKLDELTKLYPFKVFVNRVHSKTPFLSTEGIAVQWIYGYKELYDKGRLVFTAFNSKETYRDFLAMGITNGVYLPNFYFPGNEKGSLPDHWGGAANGINIGCFGAIRPLKNQLIQAMAAIQHANKARKKLYYHINASRIEQNGNQPLKNIRALFANNPEHELIEWPWLDHPSFLNIISKMDVALQVSLTESFNICTADAVYSGVPVVVGNDIGWIANPCKVAGNDAGLIARKIRKVLRYKKILIRWNKLNLFLTSILALMRWKRFLVA